MAFGFFAVILSPLGNFVPIAAEVTGLIKCQRRCERNLTVSAQVCDHALVGQPLSDDGTDAFYVVAAFASICVILSHRVDDSVLTS